MTTAMQRTNLTTHINLKQNQLIYAHLAEKKYVQIWTFTAQLYSILLACVKLAYFSGAAPYWTGPHK